MVRGRAGGRRGGLCAWPGRMMDSPRLSVPWSSRTVVPDLWNRCVHPKSPTVWPVAITCQVALVGLNALSSRFLQVSWWDSRTGCPCLRNEDIDALQRPYQPGALSSACELLLEEEQLHPGLGRRV